MKTSQNKVILLSEYSTTNSLIAALIIDISGVGITAAAGTKSCPPVALKILLYTTFFISRLITVSS